MGAFGHLVDLLPGHSGEPSHGPEVSLVSGHIILKQVIHASHSDSEILPCRILPHFHSRIVVNSAGSKRTVTVVKVLISANDVPKHLLETLRISSHSCHRHLGESFRGKIETHRLELVDHQLLGDVENRTSVVKIKDDIGSLLLVSLRTDKAVQGFFGVR